MRPPSRVLVAVALTVASVGVLTVASVGGVALVGADTPEETRGSVAAEPVPAENGSTYWRGQVLAFSVESADAYELRTADDPRLVAQLEPSDGTVLLNTTRLSPGRYVLSRGSSTTVAYEFAVVRQAVSATASDAGVTVTSNRMSYALAVESPDLSADQLRSLFPGAVERNGTVAFADLGPNETLQTDPSAVPDGEYALELRVLDADASASVSLSVSSPTTRTTADSTATDSTTDVTTTGPTSESDPTGRRTTDGGGTTDSATLPSVPGFGVPAAVVAVAVALAVAVGGRRR